MPAAMPKTKYQTPSEIYNSFHVEVGIIYIIVPRAVMPTPTHHQVSGLYGSFGLKILFVFLFKSSLFSPEASSMSRLTLLLPVDVAPPVELAVGFRVCVGSISGGLYTKNIGTSGDPSNLKRLSRCMLWYGSRRV
jgi:hypothetical protein